MKYIITESQYDRGIFRYLEMKSLVMQKKSDEIFFLKSKNNEYAQIYLYKPDGDCYVRHKLIKEVSDFFSLSKTESEEVIGRWVQKNTGVEVNDVRGIETIHFKN